MSSPTGASSPTRASSPTMASAEGGLSPLRDILAGRRGRVRLALLAVAAGGLAAGLIAPALGASPRLGAAALYAATLPVLAALLLEIVTSLHRGDVGLDIVAALAMAGALVLGEPLAGAVVAVMYAGGQFLEAYAEGRAGRRMTALLAHAPRSALRHGPEGLAEIPLDAVRQGDRLLVRKGDTLPVDGRIAPGASALLDVSALTGEPLPVRRGAGETALSGATNLGEAFDLVAERPARESTYAGIVRLVEAARAEKAPMARLADRWAMLFLGLTLVIAGVAWIASGDPVRALAVLVVATPCPLILAVPVAIVSGLSRAAEAGVLVKGGGALERLAAARVLVLDKTGTLTAGTPQLQRIVLREGARHRADEAEILRLAASLEQASSHVAARALVSAARERGLALATPTDVVEAAGDGLAGRVEGRLVAVAGAPARAGDPPGAVRARVALDGSEAAELVLADRLRPGVEDLLRDLRGTGGFARLVLATGDREAVARALLAGLPIDAIEAECAPADKVAVVTRERAHGPVVMLGDGVNDAPALAAADVGIAMGARGAAASAQAADAVVLVDRLEPVAEARGIARRARKIALQSVALGIGLSVAGMIAAALGWLTPVEGALLQEAIDVAAILNALRALAPGRGRGARVGGRSEAALSSPAAQAGRAA
ncbi:heavy metal translocating P-type ATPase [Salinarimonas rosea]|uniref:heavy metal translocating P-type ATPase n=1 Tax=Salinarimonas rosea TaxID=552063 RepID=UPI001FDA2D39|nr:heavy metal translocating P-type ATPase [Salinarimonas rosea]